jgi:hypothetical protein
MLSLTIGISYSPGMYRPPDQWPALLDWALAGRPKHPNAENVTTDVIDECHARFNGGFAKLEEELRATRAATAVVLCSDDGRLFSDVQVPQMMTFLGESLEGSVSLQQLGEAAEAGASRPTFSRSRFASCVC